MRMSRRKSFEELLESRSNARMKRDEAAYLKLAKREDEAEKMVGELNSGRFYVYPVGGKYRESASKSDLIAFLIRNNYA